MFATHFHEMTDIEKCEGINCVKNLHVSAVASDNNITMLYNIEDGPCDESYGVNVGQLTNFPNEVIEMAKRKGEELSRNSNKKRSIINIKNNTEKNIQIIKKFIELPLEV